MQIGSGCGTGMSLIDEGVSACSSTIIDSLAGRISARTSRIPLVPVTAQHRTRSHAPRRKRVDTSLSARGLCPRGTSSKRVAHKSSPPETSEKGSFGASSRDAGGCNEPPRVGGNWPRSKDCDKHTSRSTPPGLATHADATRASVRGPETSKSLCNKSSEVGCNNTLRDARSSLSGWVFAKRACVFSDVAGWSTASATKPWALCKSRDLRCSKS
mmetsp:Transcript_6787/g.21049  ORF Transcript_6787/g.21049 Transcript_6787/m.21049 type:complete len:214 (+) Transcript_6787:3076-3717(+)